MKEMTEMSAAHRSILVLALLTLFVAPPATAGDDIELDGYAEYRHGDTLVVEGQRVRADRSTKLKFKGIGRSFELIPLGFEVEVRGRRLADGSILAREVKAKPNGRAMYEGELERAFDQNEAEYRRRGRMFDRSPNGGAGTDHGALLESGARVDRVRRITRRLVPPYADEDEFRVYVVENEEWNAMAAPNGSIYVFSGLLDEMDDDEVAIVLGHELAHATHEHSRRQYKRAMWTQLAAMGALTAVAETVDGAGTRQAIEMGAMLGVGALHNGYGRGQEDQADRVGLRYAHQAGYDVSKGPELWTKFAAKYGDQPGVVNFFFGSHSRSVGPPAPPRRRALLELLAYLTRTADCQNGVPSRDGPSPCYRPVACAVAPRGAQDIDHERAH